jgi:hypothetical protein
MAGPFRAEVLLRPLPAAILAKIPCLKNGRSETSPSGGLGLLSLHARGIVACNGGVANTHR